MNKLNGAGMDTTPGYNMKAVAASTDLSPATIRAWERRYGFPQPSRTPGGHRQYSQHDIDTLKWLKLRQMEGISISHAIDLWRSYVDRREDPLQKFTPTIKESTARAAPHIEGKQIDQLREAWLAACLAFDRETAEHILTRAFALFDPATVCIELLLKGVAEAGNGWYNGDVTVQQEHFTSALTVQRLEMLIAATPSPTRQERIIVATAPGDFHIISPLLLTFLLRQSGWDVIYLGADVPVTELESTIEQLHPELIIISAQLLHTAATLKEVAVIAQSRDIPLAFGGLIFNLIPELRRLIPGHFLGRSLVAAPQLVADLTARSLPAPQWVPPSESYQQALAQFNQQRSTIESHVWNTFKGIDEVTSVLSAINNDMAQTIAAALKLGDVGLLKRDISWIEQLLMGYRLAKPLIAEFVLAYYQAAAIYLDEPASIIVEWLSEILIKENLLEKK